MKVTLINNRWTDENNNTARKGATKEEAIKQFSTLVNCEKCWDCWHCENCINCLYCLYCEDCEDCTGFELRKMSKIEDRGAKE